MSTDWVCEFANVNKEQILPYLSLFLLKFNKQHILTNLQVHGKWLIKVTYM